MKKKTVLITGASRGLGKELAQVFANHDYNLILHSKERELPCINKHFQWDRTHKGGTDVYCETVKGDLNILGTLIDLNKAIPEEGLDVLIHNAGIHEAGSFEDMSNFIEKHRESLDTNLLAPMLLTRECWNNVKKVQGLILFINSIGGKVGAKDEFLYCASKHGLKGFADSIQFDATKAGINVVSAYLGAMKTDMCKHRKDYDKLMDPKDAAKFIYDVCKNYKSMRVTEVDVCRRNYGT